VEHVAANACHVAHPFDCIRSRSPALNSAFHLETTIMRLTILALLTAAITSVAAPAFARCTYNWESAADGSSCGERSDWARQGGSIWRGY
jgi:hypothetical protein